MSDTEGDVSAPAPVVEEEAAPAAGPMDLNTAIQEVLKQAYIADGLIRGIRKCAQALDRRQALLCLLANNVDEANYGRIVEALCQEHQIRLLKVDSNKTLGEWAGLCKIDKEGNARKVVGCACVLVTDFGASSDQAQSIIDNYFKSK